MSHKFTSDGRKVAVIGALNAQETIVQEVFVADGTEFPAGEHFVVKALLDKPAETYKARKERETEENIKKLETERDRISRSITDLRFRAAAATAKAKWIEGITEPEIREVFDNLKAILCGEYTHVVIPGYRGVEIEVWDERLFSSCGDYGREGFENLRLISLFGEWNKRLTLSWKVNTYRDGSGSSNQFYPCRSLQDAISKAAELIYAQEHLSDDNYHVCLKYGIPVDEIKNAARIANKANYIKQQIADSQARTAKLEADLVAVG